MYVYEKGEAAGGSRTSVSTKGLSILVCLI